MSQQIAPTRDNGSNPYFRSDGRGHNYNQKGNNLTYPSERPITDREDTFEDPPPSGLPSDVPTGQGRLAPRNDTQHVLGGRTFADKIIESFREVAKYAQLGMPIVQVTDQPLSLQNI